MKTKRNVFLPIISAAILLLFAVVNILICTLSSTENFIPEITLIITCFALAAGMCLLKEEIFHKISPIIYLVVFALFFAQLIFGSDGFDVFKRYLKVANGIYIYTAAFLPLLFLQTSRIITKNSHVETVKLFVLFFMMCFPACLVISQPNLNPALVSFIVCYITLLILKKDKKVNVPWLALIVVPLIPVVAYFIFGINSLHYFRDKLQVILTRGLWDPLGSGWQRVNLDAILTQTPLIGETAHTVENTTVTEMLAFWGNHSAVILLAKYGWLAFSGIIAGYVLFFVCLFLMVRKTRQSSFAHYTSLMLALSLSIQAIYSLFGLFLLDCSPIEMPFITAGFTNLSIEFLSFGIILSLYLQRNKPSVLEEIEQTPFTNSSSFFTKIRELLDPDFDAYDEDDDEIDKTEETESTEDTEEADTEDEFSVNNTDHIQE